MRQVFRIRPCWVTLFGLVALVLAGPLAWAGPRDWFDQGVDQCRAQVATGKTYDCTICGVSVGCAGGRCHFGSLDASASDTAAQQRITEQGFSLYCTASGGAMLSAASAAGVQSQRMDIIFRALDEADGQSLVFSAGAAGEYRRTEATDAGGLNVPVNRSWRLGPRIRLDLPGNVVLGFADEVRQLGFNVNPMYTHLVLGSPAAGSTRMLVGLTTPLSFLVTSGDIIDSSLSWLVGAGALVGVSKRWGRLLIGGGTTIDFRYTNTELALPWLAAARVSYQAHRLLTVTGQVGLSMELLAGGHVGDSARCTVILGVDRGKWVLGYIGSYQPGDVSHGVGVVYVGSAAQAAREAEHR
jgi:hypothetical protein